MTFNKNKAIAETNAIIVGENVKLGIGRSAHCRFYDLLEKRSGAWKISDRKAIYDMPSFTFPSGAVAVDEETVRRYPREYAPLAYVLEKSGFPVRNLFATKGSELEKNLKSAGQAWLQVVTP